MVEKQIGASKVQDHFILSILIVKQVWAGKAQGKSAKAAIAKQNKVKKLVITRSEVDLVADTTGWWNFKKNQESQTCKEDSQTSGDFNAREQNFYRYDSLCRNISDARRCNNK